MMLFSSRKKTVKELDASIKKRSVIASDVSSLEKYLAEVKEYYSNSNNSHEDGTYCDGVNYGGYLGYSCCSVIEIFPSRYVFHKFLGRDKLLDCYIRLYEDFGIEAYYSIILEYLDIHHSCLVEKLSRLDSKIRYFVKKLITNYRVDLFCLIRNIIRKLLKSLDDDTDSIAQKVKLIYQSKNAFCLMLIRNTNEKERKRRMYKRLK